MVREASSDPSRSQPAPLPRVAIVTFGCRVNQADSDTMRARLAGLVAFVDEEPDVVLLNACTVTALAEKKARQAARRACVRSPAAVVVLCGCLADAVAAGWSRFPEAHVIAGNSWKPHVEELVRLALLGHRGPLAERPTEPMDRELSNGPPERIRAFLKVEDGCSGACAYCRAVQVRGPVRSKSLSAAATEARLLVARGFPEIVLSGVNLAEYRPPDGDLPELVRRLLSIEGLDRLRIASLPCNGVSDALLAAARSDSRFCPHFHLPVQSGDDRVLRAMRRGLSRAQYTASVNRIRDVFPDATLGSDIIVGFPGEDDAAFAETCRLVEDVRFSNLHIFRYSQRPGTSAAGLPGAVSETVKRRRAEQIAQLWQSIRLAILDERVGASEDVLNEGLDGGRYFGYTLAYLPVSFESSCELPAGKTARVSIVRATVKGLEGVTEHRPRTNRVDVA